MTTPTLVPAGWYTDPARRHEYRYWGGTDWTGLVSDNAVTGTDQLEAPHQAHVPGAPLLAAPAATALGPQAAPQFPSPQRPAEPATVNTAPAVPGAVLPPSGFQTPGYGQPVPAYAQAGQGFDPRLSAAMAEYSKRRYKILTGMAGTVTMERKATNFNWLLAACLFLLFGVGVLLYAGIWAIWGVHRSYRVMLALGPQGEVQEMGDVAAIFDQDRLKAHRKRCFGFGLTFAITAGIWAIATVGTTLTVHADKLTVGLTNGVLTIILAVSAYLLLKSARTAAAKLGMTASGR